MKAKKTIYLIGNPNSGKSSLFNHLTGLNQKIANYPGVTTEKKIGILKNNNKEFQILDLPGCYSLYPNSIDEKVVLNELTETPPDLIIFVANASQLNRSLMLYTQVADLGYPIILAINMLDELKKHGGEIDINLLEKHLGTKIFAINSKIGFNIGCIKDLIFEDKYNIKLPFFGTKELFSECYYSNKFSYLNWHNFVKSSTNNVIVENVKRKEIIDRFIKIEKILDITYHQNKYKVNNIISTTKIDKYLLHPFFGYSILIFMLIAIFQLIFFVSKFPMELIDFTINKLSSLINYYNFPLKKFVLNAIVPGIAGIVIFIPQISILYIASTILEESGYMARIVFLTDKIMRKFGLSGKSILPLLSGNACAIPAILSTKAIPTYKERIITILCIPFMSCSARLPVYTLFISMLIPLHLQGFVLFFLYFIGIFTALLISIIFNKKIKTNEKSYLIMEMPPLRLPTFKNIFYSLKNAITSFVTEAGKYILAISIILWFISSFSFNNLKFEPSKIENSISANIGKTIEPIIEPLGYDWKIGIALISSFAAREVFVSTLATLHNIEENGNSSSFINGLKSRINPNTNKPYFNLANGLSLLIFYAFALQCMSTVAAIKKETNSWKIPIFSFVLMSFLAYFLALITFNIVKSF